MSALQWMRSSRDDLDARLTSCSDAERPSLMGMWVAYTLSILALEQEVYGVASDCPHSVRQIDAEGYGLCMSCGQIVLEVGS